jgi:hypothetical protein
MRLQHDNRLSHADSSGGLLIPRYYYHGAIPRRLVTWSTTTSTPCGRSINERLYATRKIFELLSAAMRITTLQSHA